MPHPLRLAPQAAVETLVRGAPTGKAKGITHVEIKVDVASKKHSLTSWSAVALIVWTTAGPLLHRLSWMSCVYTSRSPESYQKELQRGTSHLKVAKKSETIYLSW